MYNIKIYNEDGKIRFQIPSLVESGGLPGPPGQPGPPGYNGAPGPPGPSGTDLTKDNLEYDVFEYNLDGILIEKKTYLNSTMNTRLYLYEYIYDEEGILIEIDILRDSDGYEYKKIFSYDENGILINIDIVEI